jgi:hypothetical protein
MSPADSESGAADRTAGRRPATGLFPNAEYHTLGRT